MRATAFTLFLFFIQAGFAQISTTGATGDWEDNAVWVGSTPPSSLTAINESSDININGYISKNATLTISNPPGNQEYFLTIVDTLVVYGNYSAAANAQSLVIPAGGLMVVFGDFTANNKVDLTLGGILVVTGNMTLSGGQQDFTDTGGKLYLDGTLSGSGDTQDADLVDEPSSNLDGGTDDEQDLFDFINTNGGNPLPISLKRFEVRAHTNTVALNWVTASEENFEYFEIQHATADGTFSVIHTVPGNGSSTEEISYSWADERPRVGLNYYRLESVDFDGYRETFPAKAINFEPENAKIGLYPNPVGLGKQVYIANTFGETYAYRLINLQGQVVSSGLSDSKDISLPSDLPSGLYTMQLEVNGLMKAEKLIVQ